jgi:hypothetical protein
MSNAEEWTAEESWEDLEERFPATPQSSCWRNKERRFLKHRRGVVMPRSDHHRVRESYLDITQGLFQDEQVWTDAGGYCDPSPSGPVVIGMEELMAISERKRARPKLTDRRIQVTGRRMEKWDSDHRSSSIPEAPKEVESSSASARDFGSNRDTRSNLHDAPSQAEERGSSRVRAEEEFYQHLWVCPARIGTRVRDNSPTLVWIRKELVDQWKFTEGDCYPLLDGDRAL